MPVLRGYYGEVYEGTRSGIMESRQLEFGRWPAMDRIVSLPTIGMAASLCLALPGTSAAEVFPGRPDVLVCSVDDPINVQPWDTIVFYVSARLEDGSVLYKSLTSNPVLVTITVDGLVEAENLADCDGKTVAELRDEGRAFDFSGR